MITSQPVPSTVGGRKTTIMRCSTRIARARWSARCVRRCKRLPQVMQVIYMLRDVCVIPMNPLLPTVCIWAHGGGNVQTASHWQLRGTHVYYALYYSDCVYVLQTPLFFNTRSIQTYEESIQRPKQTKSRLYYKARAIKTNRKKKKTNEKALYYKRQYKVGGQ